MKQFLILLVSFSLMGAEEKCPFPIPPIKKLPESYDYHHGLLFSSQPTDSYKEPYEKKYKADCKEIYTLIEKQPDLLSDSNFLIKLTIKLNMVVAVSTTNNTDTLLKLGANPNFAGWYAHRWITIVGKLAMEGTTGDTKAALENLRIILPYVTNINAGSYHSPSKKSHKITSLLSPLSLAATHSIDKKRDELDYKTHVTMAALCLLYGANKKRSEREIIHYQEDYCPLDSINKEEIIDFFEGEELKEEIEKERTKLVKKSISHKYYRKQSKNIVHFLRARQQGLIR